MTKNGFPVYKHADAFVLVLFTGMRIGEATALTAADVDLEKLNTPPETVPLDRTNGAPRPLKWCVVTASMVH